jgi:hypothetical protein
MNKDEWDGKTIHKNIEFICVHLWLDSLSAKYKIHKEESRAGVG